MVDETAWSSFVHAARMALQVFLNLVQPGELWGVAALILIGIPDRVGSGKDAGPDG